MPLPYDSLFHQFGGAFHVGLLVNRPLAAAMGTTDQFWWASDTLSVPGGQTLYVTVLAGGVLAWVVVGGAGSSSATAAMKYFVNNSPTTAPQPLCLYTTIAAATTAAIADGHNATNPAVIWLCPTALPLTENVTMVPGISIKGMVDSYHPITSAIIPVDTMPTIAGIVDIGAGQVSLSNLRVVGQILVSPSAGGVQPSIESVQVYGTVALLIAIRVINANAFVMMNRVAAIAAVTPGSVALYCDQAATVQATDCDFHAQSASTAAMDLGAASTHSFADTSVEGLVTSSATSVVEFNRCTVTSSGAAPFTANGTSALSVRRCRITTSFAVFVAGTGSLVDLDNEYSTVAGTVATTITTAAPRAMHRPVKEVIIAPAGAITTTDEAFTVTAVAGNTTLTLLAANLVPLGYEFSVKKVSATNALVIGRAGADTIDGQVSVTLAATTQGAVRLRAIAGGYSIVAAYGVVTSP